jgi:hypothetical protein
MVLHALAANGQPATLHSHHIAADVAQLVEGAERERWRSHRLPHGAPKAAFRAVVAALPPVDLMLHDSHHTLSLGRCRARDGAAENGAGGADRVKRCRCVLRVIDVCRRHALAPLPLPFPDTFKVLALLPLAAPQT